MPVDTDAPTDHYVEYDHNNSGGRWWLTDEDWRALAKAGWEVDWYAERDDKFFKPDGDGRWLGALASRATRRGLTLREAAAEWERVTGQTATDAGCPCCGPPHFFTEYDADDRHVASGPDTSYEASW